MFALIAISWPAAASAQVVVLELDGSVQPASLRYVERGIREAQERGAQLVILELDTPGGSLVALRSMTTAITQSRVPVAVYVTPAGARAASAGFFLLISADVAAMAPGTNTGAAHPVALGGPGPKDSEQDVGTAKATEDAAALIRALAEKRGRSVEWAEKAVRESSSYSAEEAVEHELVEIVAPDRAALITELDGRRVTRFDGSTQTLQLRGADIYVVEQTFAERVLTVIADPQVAYLLLLLGLLGLMVELMSPGAVVPGVVGGLFVLLALYALSVLPVNWAGVLLMALGAGLLVAEAYVTSYGALSIGGVASFILGSLILIETPIPSARIGLGLVLPAAIVLTAASVLLLSRVLRLRKARLQSGLEAMVGEIGEVARSIEERRGEGKVFVHGEYWTATSAEPLARGEKVRVERVEGNRLHVASVRLAPA
ncbi:MAG: nodulation protein NfeD [Polyangiaceae bacterium]|nr:nodulation protein NfeD [Polyangiaceae bacterium]